MATNEDTILSQYVPGFRANLNLAPQQLDTRLLSAVDSDLAYGEPGQMFNADDVQTSDPEDINARVPETPDKFIGRTRRIGYFLPFHDAQWIDNVDKARELEDPTSKIMKAMTAGRWRKVDSLILSAGIGNAYSLTGPLQDGAPTSTALPAAQIIAANDTSFTHDAEVVPTDGSDYGLSVGKILNAGYILDESELEGQRHLAISSYQKAELLRRTPVTSRYYQEVLALQSGKINEFLGFTIHRLQKARFQFNTHANEVGKVTQTRRLMAWVEGAIVYRARPITDAQIWRRQDRSNTPQAFYKGEQGCVRRYDTAVVEIDCYEGPTY